MSKDGVKLLGMWASPFCMRVKVALAEKGVEYEEQEENLFGGKSEELLKSNPLYEKVPVLLHNGKPVVESTNIVAYIDETWATPSLLPACAYGRSRARFWADYIDKKVFEAGGVIWRGNAEEVEAGKKEFIGILKNLEGAMGEKDYFNGDSFGFVDILLIGITPWFLAFERYGGFKVEESCPKISGWIERCLERESVSKSLADSEKVYACVGMLRKMNGVEQMMVNGY